MSTDALRAEFDELALSMREACAAYLAGDPNGIWRTTILAHALVLRDFAAPASETEKLPGGTEGQDLSRSECKAKAETAEAALKADRQGSR